MHCGDIIQRLSHSFAPHLDLDSKDRRGSILQTCIFHLQTFETTRRLIHSPALFPNPVHTFFRFGIRGISKAFCFQEIESPQELAYNIPVPCRYQSLHQDRQHTFALNQKLQAYSHFGILLAVAPRLVQNQARGPYPQREKHELVCNHLST